MIDFMNNIDLRQPDHHYRLAATVVLVLLMLSRR